MILNALIGLSLVLTSQGDIVFDHDPQLGNISMNNTRHDCIHGLDLKEHCIAFSPNGKVYLIETSFQSNKMHVSMISPDKISGDGMAALNKKVLNEGISLITRDMKKLETITGKKDKAVQEQIDEMKRALSNRNSSQNKYYFMSEWVQRERTKVAAKLQKSLAELDPANAKKLQSKFEKLNDKYLTPDEKTATWADKKNGNLYLVEDNGRGKKTKTLLVPDVACHSMPLTVSADGSGIGKDLADDAPSQMNTEPTENFYE